MSEQDYRIQSPELAHHMGYAEYPYHELATHALKLGLDKKYEEHMREAHEAGMSVLREHVQSAQQSLNHFEDKSEENIQPKQEQEPTQEVWIDRIDFEAFAKQYTQERHSGNIVTTRILGNKAWQAIHGSVADEDKNRLQSMVHRKSEDDTWYTGSVGFSGLVELVDSVKSLYREADTEQAKARVVKGFFGHRSRVGFKSWEYIEKFVGWKKQQLEQASSKDPS